MNNQIEIKFNKFKIILSILVMLLFFFMGYLLFSNSSKLTSTLFNSPKFIHYIGILIMIYCFLFITTTVSKLFSRKLGLILDDDGIINNSTEILLPKIYWNDISKIRTMKFGIGKYLLIDLKNEKDYVSQFNFFKKIIITYNKIQFGTYVRISHNTLRNSIDELEHVISEYYIKFGDKYSTPL